MPSWPDGGAAPSAATALQDEENGWRQRLGCGFVPVQSIFAKRLSDARVHLRDADLAAYIDAARVLCRLGRGPEPVLAFLEAWPQAAGRFGQDGLAAIMAWARGIGPTPNGDVLGGFFRALPALADALDGSARLKDYIDLLNAVARHTTVSIHGRHATYASHALPELIRVAPPHLKHVSLAGLRTWAEHGLRHDPHNPQRQADYFAMRSADSRAVFQDQRRGTSLRAHERRMDLYLRAFWNDAAPIIAYSEAFDHLRKPQPYTDDQGLHLPDLRDDRDGVSGLDQYRLILAHLAAHRRLSEPLIADNWSPFQRLCIEYFEDARIDTLVLRRFPGLRKTLLSLHPYPGEHDCDSARESCIRHRLTMLSRAILDPDCDYGNPLLREFVGRFHDRLIRGDSSTQEMAALATEYLVLSRLPSDNLPKIHFADSEIPYRDDNRHLWRFIDLDEDQEEAEVRAPEIPAAPGITHHYPEWDYAAGDYLPDHVTLHEHLHPRGLAEEITRLLEKNAVLARRLTRILDQIKPQGRDRLRRQEDGAELDLDWALRSWIDYRCRHTADARINQDIRHAERDVAVSLLLDLSASLADPIGGAGDRTVLSLAQEAVTLLAWAIDRLGDPFAIAGFHSNTRHEARIWHIKGFSEAWNDDVRARLAALRAGYSTRMGVALRHAGRALSQIRKDKRLLLVLTDGQPADVDVSDPEFLIADARQAVRELERQGVTCHCISLDIRSDEYVQRIFGRHFSVIDRIERLPERLPEIFLTITS